MTPQKKLPSKSPALLGLKTQYAIVSQRTLAVPTKKSNFPHFKALLEVETWNIGYQRKLINKVIHWLITWYFLKFLKLSSIQISNMTKIENIFNSLSWHRWSLFDFQLLCYILKLKLLLGVLFGPLL